MRKIKYRNWIYEIMNETSPGPSPTGEGDWEIKQVVRKALAKLSKEEKILIEQFYFEGKSHKEIGQILNLNSKQVEYLKQKAVFKLRNLLADFVARKYKIQVSQFGQSNMIRNRQKPTGCVICQNPKQKEIEVLIASKRDHQTWRVILKKLRQKFNLEIKSPQILVGHMKHRVGSE